MKVAVIVADRGDRPQFMQNCLRLIQRQTMYQAGDVIVIPSSTPPLNDQCDITRRYRIAYGLVSHLTGVDVIAFMENDDWYSADYLQIMVEAWIAKGKPDLFGTTSTIYFHLRLWKHFTFNNSQKSHMMNTLIKPGLNITWPADTDPYTDQWLWMGGSNILKKAIFSPPWTISIGMKHGVGKLGGRNHVDDLRRFENEDDGFLASTVDTDSYQFYCGMRQELNKSALV